MPRSAKKKGESGIYHITMRGINRQQIFASRREQHRRTVPLCSMPAGNYCGFTTDRYLKPIVIHKGKKKASHKRAYKKPLPRRYYCLAY